MPQADDTPPELWLRQQWHSEHQRQGHTWRKRAKGAAQEHRKPFKGCRSAASTLKYRPEGAGYFRVRVDAGIGPPLWRLQPDPSAQSTMRKQRQDLGGLRRANYNTGKSVRAASEVPPRRVPGTSWESGRKRDMICGPGEG